MLGILGGRAITFLMGPAGRIGLLALSFFAWTLYQRYDATRDCEALELREELIESQRQLAVANQIAEDARVRADQTDEEMSEVRTLNDKLKKSLQDVASCPIDPGTRERLLRIK